MHSRNLFSYIDGIEDALFIYSDFACTDFGALHYVRLSIIRASRAVICPRMRAGRDHVVGAAGLSPSAPDWSRSGRVTVPPGSLPRQAVGSGVRVYRMVALVTFTPCLLSGPVTRPAVRGKPEQIPVWRSQLDINDSIHRQGTVNMYTLSLLNVLLMFAIVTSLQNKMCWDLKSVERNISATTLTTLKTS